VVHAPKITGKRRYFRPGPEQLEQIDLISKLKVSIKNNNNLDLFTKLKYKVAIKKFRSMQRKQMYNNQIKSAIQLEDFMHNDKNKFWKNIKQFLKKNKNSSVSETIPIS